MQNRRKEIMNEVRKTLIDARSLQQRLTKTEKDLREFEKELDKVKNEVAKAKENLRNGKADSA